MIAYEQALHIATEKRSEIDSYEEMTDAFIFGKSDDLSFGGQSPVVVMKEDGRCINMVAYCDIGECKSVREGSIEA